MLKWQNTVTSSILAVPNVIAHPSTDINETYCTTDRHETSRSRLRPLSFLLSYSYVNFFPIRLKMYEKTKCRYCWTIIHAAVKMTKPRCHEWRSWTWQSRCSLDTQTAQSAAPDESRTSDVLLFALPTQHAARPYLPINYVVLRVSK